MFQSTNENCPHYKSFRASKSHEDCKSNSEFMSKGAESAMKKKAAPVAMWEKAICWKRTCDPTSMLKKKPPMHAWHLERSLLKMEIVCTILLRSFNKDHLCGVRTLMALRGTSDLAAERVWWSFAVRPTRWNVWFFVAANFWHGTPCGLVFGTIWEVISVRVECIFASCVADVLAGPPRFFFCEKIKRGH